MWYNENENKVTTRVIGIDTMKKKCDMKTLVRKLTVEQNIENKY